jgi:hypothetical protein
MTVNCFSPLTPIIPALTVHSPVSPIIPALTRTPGGGGQKPLLQSPLPLLALCRLCRSLPRPSRGGQSFHCQPQQLLLLYLSMAGRRRFAVRRLAAIKACSCHLPRSAGSLAPFPSLLGRLHCYSR